MSLEREIIEELNNLNEDNDNDVITEDDTICDISKKKIYSCELCNVHVTGNRVLKRHMEGRKHKARVERQGKTFICELCNVNCNSQSQLDSHLKSSKHKTRQWKKDHPEIYLTSCIWIVGLFALYFFVNFVLKFFLDKCLY